MIRLTFDILAVHPIVLERIKQCHMTIVEIEAHGPYMVVVVRAEDESVEDCFVMMMENASEEINLDNIEYI